MTPFRGASLLWVVDGIINNVFGENPHLMCHDSPSCNEKGGAVRN